MENQTSKIPVRLQLQDQEYQHRLTDFLKTYGKEQVVIQESPANSGVLLSDQDGEATGELVLRLSFEDMTKEGEISAYQRATDLLALIRSHWGQNQESIVRTYAPVKDTGPSAIAQEAPDYGIVKPFGRLTGVFSPVGGCGKTTFAVAYSELYAKKFPSKKVLYWNAEGAADWRLYFQNECPFNLSDLIYCILMEGENGLEEYLRELAVGQTNGIYFIKPCNSFQDLNVLQPAELIQLLRVLTGYFDQVVCDMNTAFENINRQILGYCGKSFFLVSDMPGSRLKFQDFLESLKKQKLEDIYLSERCELIPIGGRSSEWKELEKAGIPIQAPLPWCSRLFRENGGKLQLRQDSSYYERIRQIVQS